MKIKVEIFGETRNGFGETTFFQHTITQPHVNGETTFGLLQKGFIKQQALCSKKRKTNGKIDNLHGEENENQKVKNTC